MFCAYVEWLLLIQLMDFLHTYTTWTTGERAAQRLRKRHLLSPGNRGKNGEKINFSLRSRFKGAVSQPNLFMPLIIMSGLDRLFVPDLGDQVNLMPLYQSGQVCAF